MVSVNTINLQLLHPLSSIVIYFCHSLGHSGPVRSVYVQDSEHCFLSASKDKTVKLWSLSNHGDGTAQSASSWTYYRHTRQVFHVGMVEAVRQAVSCDGSLHVSYDFVPSISFPISYTRFFRYKLFVHICNKVGDR